MLIAVSTSVRPIAFPPASARAFARISGSRMLAFSRRHNVIDFIHRSPSEKDASTRGTLHTAGARPVPGGRRGPDRERGGALDAEDEDPEWTNVGGIREPDGLHGAVEGQSARGGGQAEDISQVLHGLGLRRVHVHDLLGDDFNGVERRERRGERHEREDDDRCRHKFRDVCAEHGSDAEVVAHEVYTRLVSRSTPTSGSRIQALFSGFPRNCRTAARPIYLHFCLTYIASLRDCWDSVPRPRVGGIGHPGRRRPATTFLSLPSIVSTKRSPCRRIAPSGAVIDSSRCTMRIDMRRTTVAVIAMLAGLAFAAASPQTLSIGAASDLQAVLPAL